MSRTTRIGASRYNNPLIANPTAMVCADTATNTSTTASAAMPMNATDAPTRIDRGARAVCRVSHTVAIWIASTTEWPRSVGNETASR